jgi:hypothetical protein
VNGIAMRAVLIALAVVVLAWLAVAERSARLQARGLAATARQDFAAAEADFRAARLLNPDTTPDLQRAFVYLASSRQPQGIALIQGVLRREPDSRDAWGLLEQFTRDSDPAMSRRATAALRRLDPLRPGDR